MKSRQIIRFFCVVGGGIALITAGCTLPKAPDNSSELWQPPEKIRNRILETTSKHPPAPWTAEDTVSLPELIDYALASSPKLHRSIADARQMEALMRQAKGAYYPSADLSASGEIGRTDANAMEKTVDYSSYTPTASLTWLLIDGGGRNASVQAAAQNLISANYQFNRKLQTLLLNVQTDYYSLYSAQAEVSAAEDNLAATATTLESARKRQAAKLAVHLDVLRAQTDFEQARYNLESARAAEAKARGQLANTIGLPANTPLHIDPPQAPLPTEDEWDEDRLAAMIESALISRPDIASARALVRAARHSVRTASSERLPELSARLSAGFNSTRYSEDAVSDTDTTTMLASLSLSWNIFNGYYTLNRKREAEAALKSATEQLRAAELNATQDVWASFFAFRSSIRKLAFAQAALESSRAAYMQATDSYMAGLKDITFLLDAQSKLADARKIFVESEKDIYTAYLNLLHALGELSP